METADIADLSNEVPLRRRLNTLRMYVREGWVEQANRVVDEICAEYGRSSGCRSESLMRG
jgi:hypothetical protein